MIELIKRLITLICLMPIVAYANIPYTLEELENNTFYEVFLDEDCGPEWVLEPFSFGVGTYALELCDGVGGGTETGTYSLTPAGVIQIVYPGGMDFIRRISFDSAANGWRVCWAATEAETLNCSEEDLSLGMSFKDFASAEVFWLQQNGISTINIPLTGLWGLLALALGLSIIEKRSRL